MSSYLNICIPLENDKRITIGDWSRSSDIYTAFNENCNVPYGSNNATELTTTELSHVYNDTKEEIEKTKKRLNELEKHANGNIEIIDEILEWKYYIESQQKVLNYVNVLQDILQTMNPSYLENKDESYKLIYYIS